MTITLTPRQQAWLESQVEAGVVPSVEDAVRAAVADYMAIAEDDLAWAAPYVEAAREAMTDGKAIEGRAFLDRLRNRTSRGAA